MNDKLFTLYSTNDEDFDCHSVEDAIDQLEVGETYYEADFRRMCGKDVVHVRWLIESLDEQLYDLVGEAAEDGLDYSKEAFEELKAILYKWVDEHTDIARYYTIEGKSRKKVVTEEVVQ